MAQQGGFPKNKFSWNTSTCGTDSARSSAEVVLLCVNKCNTYHLDCSLCFCSKIQFLIRMILGDSANQTLQIHPDVGRLRIHIVLIITKRLITVIILIKARYVPIDTCILCIDRQVKRLKPPCLVLTIFLDSCRHELPFFSLTISLRTWTIISRQFFRCKSLYYAGLIVINLSPSTLLARAFMMPKRSLFIAFTEDLGRS